MKNKAGIVLSVLLSAAALVAQNRSDVWMGDWDSHDPVLDPAGILCPSLGEQVKEKLGSFIAQRIASNQVYAVLQTICSAIDVASDAETFADSEIVLSLRNNLSSVEMAQIDSILN